MLRESTRIALTVTEATRLLALARPRGSSDVTLLAELSDLITRATERTPRAPKP